MFKNIKMLFWYHPERIFQYRLSEMNKGLYKGGNE